MIFSGQFWLETFERALKTAAQSVTLAWVGGDTIANLFTMDLNVALGAAGGGFLLSVLTSVASAPVGTKHSPSLVTGEPGLDPATPE